MIELETSSHVALICIRMLICEDKLLNLGDLFLRVVRLLISHVSRVPIHISHMIKLRH